MPSTLHEALIALFRANLRLIELLTAPLLPLPAEGLGELRTEEANLTEVRPVERRADLAILSANGPAFVLEVQLAMDSAKRWTWPAYAALSRDRLRRDVILVVLTLEAGVADWARTPIRLDPLGSQLCPLVIGPEQIPLITDLAQARAAPEQLVLSALAHGEGPAGVDIARTTAAVAPFLDEERGRFYIDLVSSALGPVARAVLEAAMFENYEYRSELFRRLVAQGKAEGKAEGRAEGAHIALTEAILGLLRARNIPIDATAQARVDALPDAAAQLRCINRALTATSLDELLGDDA